MWLSYLADSPLRHSQASEKQGTNDNDSTPCAWYARSISPRLKSGCTMYVRTAVSTPPPRINMENASTFKTDWQSVEVAYCSCQSSKGTFLVCYPRLTCYMSNVPTSRHHASHHFVGWWLHADLQTSLSKTAGQRWSPFIAGSTKGRRVLHPPCLHRQV